MNKKSTFKGVANSYLTHTKNQKGITLIALIVTIIVLIILAGISVNLILGENGIINRAKDSGKAYNEAQDLEKLYFEYTEYLIVQAHNQDGKTFIEYLDEKGYIVDYTDNNNTTGIVAVNGMVYNIAADGKAQSTGITVDKLKPIISSVEATVEGKTISVVTTVKNSEGARFRYILRKENSNTIISQSDEINDLTYQFTNLETDVTYIISVEATNENGTSEPKSARGRTESLRGATEGKGSFTKNTDEENQPKITLTVNNTFEDNTISIQYKKGADGTWTTYSEPFDVDKNITVFGRYIDLITEEIGAEFSIQITNIDDIPPEEASISLSSPAVDAGQTITATVIQQDNQTGIAITNCKYIVNQSADEIGINSTEWNTATAFETIPQEIQITESSRKIDYLHVLSVDGAGNKIETVSDSIRFKGSFRYASFIIPGNYTSFFNGVNVDSWGMRKNSYIISKEPIDVTNLKSISLVGRCSGEKSYGGDGWQPKFGIGRNNDDTTLDRSINLPISGTSTYTLNVEDLEGEYYIKVTLFSYGSAYENVHWGMGVSPDTYMYLNCSD